MYFTEEGQQGEKRTPFCANSLASYLATTSAPNATSNTSSNPKHFKAVTT